MSSDSTELHFVRCPSCRSLVPASSKTCRMCGAALEAGAKGEDPSSESRRSGRVRQRTMSTAADELNSAVHKIREEMGIDATPSSAAPIAPPAEADGPEDPLSAYIEEVDPVAGAADAHAGKNGSLAKAPDYAESTPVSASSYAPPTSTPFEATASERSTKPMSAMRPAASATEQAENKPRVVVESGAKRRGPGLSFGTHAQEELAASEDEQFLELKPEAQFDNSSDGDEGEPPAPPSRVAPSAPLRSHREGESRDDRAFEARRPERREEARSPQQAQPQPKQEAARSVEIQRKNVTSGGRLVGWLVSYRDSDGRATEVREGKFFVSRSRVKDSDLVVDDRSVSSPHALVAIAAGQHMRVQDLMSDNGVFVKRRGESDFIRIAETAELEHGDWIKFGDVEYCICLIAHVGEK